MGKILDKATMWFTAGAAYAAGRMHPYKPLRNAYFNIERSSSATTRTNCGNLKTETNNIPQYHYREDGTPWLLLEPAATNLHDSYYLFSQEYSNTRQDNVDSDPFGLIRASRLIATTTSQPRFEGNISPVANTKYTWSIFFKRYNTDYVAISTYTIASDHYAHFNIANGTIISTYASTAKIEAYADGWYRCSMTYTLPSNPTIHYRKIHVSTSTLPYEANIGDGVTYFGPQLEVGELSSYILTLGSSSSRALTYGGRFTNGEYTIDSTGVGGIYLDWIPTDLTDGNYCSIGSTSGDHRILLGAEGGQLRWYYVVNGAAYAGGLGGTIGTRYKILHLFGNGKSRVYVNGVLATNTTTQTTFPSVDRINFGSVDYQSQPLRGYVKDFAVFNQFLTPAEAVSLTTI